MGVSAEAMHCVIENGIFLFCAQNKCSICSLSHLICHRMCCGRVLFSWWNTRAVDILLFLGAVRFLKIFEWDQCC